MYDSLSIVCAVITLVLGGSKPSAFYKYAGSALVASTVNLVMLLVQKYCTTKGVAQRITNLVGLVIGVFTLFAWGR